MDYIYPHGYFAIRACPKHVIVFCL